MPVNINPETSGDEVSVLTEQEVNDLVDAKLADAVGRPGLTEAEVNTLIDTHLAGYARQSELGGYAQTPVARASLAADVQASLAKADTAVQPTPTPPTPPAGSRDPLKQPFASSSIWNMPIGTGAVYVRANMTAVPNNDPNAPIPYSDDERISMTPTAPMTAIRWNNDGDRCTPGSGTPPSWTSDPVATVPIPANWVVPSSGDNGCSAHLMPNGRTVIQTQYFARCSGRAPTAEHKTPGNPGSPDPDVDLYGPGIRGSHGGSGLSALGGCLRVGELRPGDTTGPRHALKIVLWAQGHMYNANTAADTYRWPADRSDSGSVSSYGSVRSGPPALKMGALLAMPTSVTAVSLGLESAAGKLLFWTLQNYGAYVVDTTGAGIAFCTEDGPAGSFEAQFQADWGFAFESRANQASTQAWQRDMQKFMVNFHVVDNNGPNSVGGGGTPLQPLAPEIAP